MTWEGLSPPYSTILADPPWSYNEGWPNFGDRTGAVHRDRKPLPYPSMTVPEILALPVSDLAADNAHLYLWTTNRYLRTAFDVVTAWGFKFSSALVWCKTPMGIGPGGAFSITTEFVLFARRGSVPPARRVETTWWQYPRHGHSVKPDEFFDVIERASPGPFVELFARRRRAGWDCWGDELEAIA